MEIDFSLLKEVQNGCLAGGLPRGDSGIHASPTCAWDLGVLPSWWQTGGDNGKALMGDSYGPGREWYPVFRPQSTGQTQSCGLI